jgi:flagellar hook-associated protein 2
MAATGSVDLISNQIDVNSIVTGLMNLERQPINSLQSQVKELQSKNSAYQNLNTKLSALSDKTNTILFGDANAPYVKPYSYADRLSKSIFAKCTITSSDSDKVTATASNVNIGGSYALTVSNLAKAQSSQSTGFADKDTTRIGTGTLTITKGDENPVSIAITSSNNTLEGLQSAINSAKLGITATVVNDGSASPYKLMLSSNETGTANAFTISTSLSGGAAISFSESQAAEDAAIAINGINITKSSNTIDDVINGVTFTLKDKTTVPVTLNLANDQDSIVSAIKDLTTAYNSVNSFINGQFSYNSSTESSGVLAGDATLRSVQSKLQAQWTQGIANRYTSLGVTGQAGLEFNKDGSLTLNEDEFRKALSDNFTNVAALFLGDGTAKGQVTASDSRVAYNTKTSATQAGNYDVSVTALAEQASSTGEQTITSLADNETLSITYGTATAMIELQQYDSLDTILSRINSALSAQGISATAKNNGSDKLQIVSNGYGSSEALTIVSNQDSALGTTGFGTTPITVNGIDISGTIGNTAAIGNGLTLTGDTNQPAEGLSLSISQDQIGSYGTVTVAPNTSGVEGKSILINLTSMLDGLTDSLSGPIHNAMDGLTKNIRSLNDSISSFEERLTSKQESLTNEFGAANNALKLLQLTQAQFNASLSKA